MEALVRRVEVPPDNCFHLRKHMVAEIIRHNGVSGI
jgi:hypothetical protein